MSNPSNRPSSTSDYEAFVARYERPLRAFFSKRIDRQEDVEDLVQELFGRVLSSNGEKTIENPDGYVFQAAANLLRERYRNRGTRSAAMTDLPFIQKGSEEIDPERILQGKEELRLLELALTELPVRTRTVFLLHRFEGFKYREIAERIGVSVSSVEKHIAAAARHIAARMDRN